MPLVTQYQWQNVHCFTNRVFFSDKYWVFMEKECQTRLYKHHKKGGDVVDSSGYIIQTRQIPLPDMTDLVKWIYLYNLTKSLTSMAKESKPGSKMPEEKKKWCQTVDKYYVSCKSRIDPSQISAALKKIVSLLTIDIPPQLPDMYTMLLVSRMINGDLLRELKEPVTDIREEFYRLFDRVCPNLREWSMCIEGIVPHDS